MTDVWVPKMPRFNVKQSFVRTVADEMFTTWQNDQEQRELPTQQCKFLKCEEYTRLTCIRRRDRLKIITVDKLAMNINGWRKLKNNDILINWV